MLRRPKKVARQQGVIKIRQILLCSDGFYAARDGQAIATGFVSDPQQWAEALAAMVLAKNRQGQDNLTVAILATIADQQVNRA